MIEVDFETFKEITRRRPDENVTEGQVVKEALGLVSHPQPTHQPASADDGFWESEGVKFRVGTVLEHRFRDGRVVEAKVTARGVEVHGVVYSGLSPAGASITKHQLNGWHFWFLRDEEGRLVSADTLRKR